MYIKEHTRPGRSLPGADPGECRYIRQKQESDTGFQLFQNTQSVLCYLIMVAVILLLVYRDVMGGSVNKYVFCVLIIPYLLLAEEDNALILFGFLMPLYVGLPRNFITPVFLLKLLIGKNVSLHLKELLCTVFLMAFMLFQNFLYGFTGMYNMICIVELPLVYMIMFRNDRKANSDFILAYSIGTAVTGVVMLTASLRQVSLSELLNVASRLGDYQYSEGMSINLDPNFYGLFVITAITCDWLLVQNGIFTGMRKTLALVSALVSIPVAFIGLSRGFILCLAIWAVLTMLFGKKLGSKVKIVFMGTVLVAAAFILFPNVLQSLIQRFQGSDVTMTTDNGRVDLLQRYGSLWLSSVQTILIGIGLFVSEAHCMQAQFLYALGIVGSIPLFTLGFLYFRYSLLGQKVKAEPIIPLIVIQICSAMLPGARTLTFMMPVVISFLVMQVYYGEVTAAENEEASREEQSIYLRKRSGSYATQYLAGDSSRSSDKPRLPGKGLPESTLIRP